MAHIVLRYKTVYSFPQARCLLMAVCMKGHPVSQVSSQGVDLLLIEHMLRAVRILAKLLGGRFKNFRKMRSHP